MIPNNLKGKVCRRLSCQLSPKCQWSPIVSTYCTVESESCTTNNSQKASKHTKIMLTTNDPVSNNEDCMKDPTMTWWGAKKRDSKAVISDSELLDYIKGRLATAPHCGSQNCNCLSILLLPSVITSIASYLVFFERQSKHQQDTILLDWILYRISLPQSKCHFF